MVCFRVKISLRPDFLFRIQLSNSLPVFAHFACLLKCSTPSNLEPKCAKYHWLDLCDVCWGQRFLKCPIWDLCRKGVPYKDVVERIPWTVGCVAEPVSQPKEVSFGGQKSRKGTAISMS